MSARGITVTVASQCRPDPREQFEAARVLRRQGWSYFRISQALGLTLSQVRVAVDPRAAECHDRWAAQP